MTASKAFAEDRNAVRDEVECTVRAFGPDARPMRLLISNISGRGLMARCDRGYAIGETITVDLPIIGVARGVIRWALGGRIGCEFDQPLGSADYYELLALMLRHPDLSRATPASRSNR